ncbi:MAG: hypothetical protein KAT30_01595, partial [Candidatus Krumholzibacteria bacterium]|nr:hypothetical protein [Candidatus Krumholzibacteria bacterium]
MGSAPPKDAYPRQPGIDAIHYVFRVTLRDDTDRIAAEAEVSIRFRYEGVTELALDLASVSRVSGGKGMTVSEVTSEGGPVPWVHEADRLRITLAEAPAQGELRRFTVHYGGTPAAGLKIGPNRYGERTFFSVNWPDKARHWLPMIDHPYDKATSEFIVTAPVHYQVVANGLLQEETNLGDGQRRTHWKQSVPIPSWLNALGVARFASRHFGSINGIPLQTWVFHQDREAGIATFEVPVRQAMAFFIERIGPYSYEKLANVEVAGMGGGMEHASVIFYGARSVTMQPATGLVTHEIAHQWFGNSVTESDWDDVWLSEGFATYFTLLFREHTYGRDDFLRGLRESQAQVYSYYALNPDYRILHDELHDMSKVLTGMQYQKGSWTLHMLRSLVGTENFWKGIRLYYARYRDRCASTADFRGVMEEVSGMKLDWFFDQWLTTTRVLDYKLANVSRSSDGSVHKTEVTIVNKGDAVMPVEIEIEFKDGSVQKRRVDGTAQERKIEFTSNSKAKNVGIDPDRYLLDFDRTNNSSGGLPKNFKPFLSLASTKEYPLMYAPYIWQNDVDGLHIGGFITGFENGYQAFIPVETKNRFLIGLSYSLDGGNVNYQAKYTDHLGVGTRGLWNVGAWENEGQREFRASTDWRVYPHQTFWKHRQRIKTRVSRYDVFDASFAYPFRRSQGATNSLGINWELYSRGRNWVNIFNADIKKSFEIESGDFDFTKIYLKSEFTRKKLPSGLSSMLVRFYAASILQGEV